jgi:DNA-directed RNA polymerase subunit RPC12/RpoP
MLEMWGEGDLMNRYPLPYRPYHDDVWPWVLPKHPRPKPRPFDYEIFPKKEKIRNYKCTCGGEFNSPATNKTGQQACPFCGKTIEVKPMEIGTNPYTQPTYPGIASGMFATTPKDIVQLSFRNKDDGMILLSDVNSVISIPLTLPEAKQLLATLVEALEKAPALAKSYAAEKYKKTTGETL